jgi:uncharacterized membrane protein (DUF2068 family)
VKRRPRGITILSIYGYVNAAALIGYSIWSLFAPKDSTLDILRSIGIQSARHLAIFAPLFLLYMVVFGILSAVVAYGLWHLNRWAWIVTIILVCWNLVQSVITMFTQLARGPQYSRLFDIVVEVLIAW